MRDIARRRTQGATTPKALNQAEGCRQPPSQLHDHPATRVMSVGSGASLYGPLLPESRPGNEGSRQGLRAAWQRSRPCAVTGSEGRLVAAARGAPFLNSRRWCCCDSTTRIGMPPATSATQTNLSFSIAPVRTLIESARAQRRIAAPSASLYVERASDAPTAPERQPSKRTSPHLWLDVAFAGNNDTAVSGRPEASEPLVMVTARMLLSIVSLLLSFVAVFVNASGIVRRPRIVARWGTVSETPFREGLSIVITARRRPIQVDEVGLVKLERRPCVVLKAGRRHVRLLVPRRRFPEWHRDDVPVRLPLGARASGLPIRLQDGESTRLYIDLDDAIDALHPRSKFAYVYVQASGIVYLTQERVDDPPS